MESGIEIEALNVFSFEAGYYNTDNLRFPEGALAPGSKNLLLTGQDSLRVFRGMKNTGVTGGRSMFQIANGFASLVDGTSQGNGSIFNYINESLFYIGGGNVYLNGAASGLAEATSTLRFAPKVGSSYPTAYAAGMTAPSAPAVSAMSSVSGTAEMVGVYSVKIARVRSATGGRSVASPTSAAIELSAAQSIKVSFASVAALTGQDKWAIFVTKAGFGGVGVHYLYNEILDSALTTIGGTSRSYELSFNDSDLLPTTAFIDDYPPQAGKFAARLENYICIIGAYTNAIQASIRNFPESYHPEYIAFLPKEPTAVLPDQQGSYVYVATPTSVHALSVAPAAYDNPLMLQTVWSDTGIQYAHNWCAHEGVIFAFVSRQGAVTMNALGQPSSEFAMPVAKEMRSWEVADTCVFACPDLNCVIYTNNGVALAFNLQNRKWSPPIYISEDATGTIISGVVHNRRLRLCLLSGGTFSLYEFDETSSGGTTGNTTYVAVSPDVELNPAGRINILGMKAKFCASQSLGADTQIKLFCDYAASSSPTKTLSHAASAVGMQTTKQTRYYLPRKMAVRVAIEGTQTNFANDCFPSFVVIYGTREGSNSLIS